MRQLCKGNVAVIKGALLAGCRAYYGYPITPASEVAEAAALYSAGSRRHIRASRKRNSFHQHGVWCGLRRRARHDRVLWSGIEPDAGRHLLSRRG